MIVERNILPEGASRTGVIGGRGNIDSDVIVGRNIVPGNDLRNDEDEGGSGVVAPPIATGIEGPDDDEKNDGGGAGN